MGAIDIALAAAQSSRRRRRPDPLAAIGAAVATGVDVPSILGGAVADGIAPEADPTYAPRSIAERRMFATRAPQPTQRRALDARQRRPAPRTQQQTLLERLNRPFAPGEQITPRQTALLAEAAGLPGRTYSRSIVPGESNYQPGVRNPDDATPSLFQITPSVQSAETQATFQQIAREHPGGYSNPVAAARQAAFLAGDSVDEGVGNYVAYNPSGPQGHLRGGARRAQRILGGPLESVAGARAGRGPRQLSVNELIHDPGITMFDGQVAPSDVGGHESHVHFASDRPRDVLTAAKIAQRLGLDVRENPLFDPVDPVHTEGSEHYQERELPEQLRPLARRLGGEGDTIGDAIDVSGGSAEQLLRLDEILARRSGTFVPSAATGSVATGGGGPVAPSSAPLGVSDQALGPYADMVQRRLGALRRSPIGTRAPLPSARNSLLSPTEEDDEETTLAALLGDSFRPQRRLAL